MSMLIGWLLGNVVVAALLAAFAYAAGRWLQRPPLTHGLWLLVYVKLLTPPLMPVAVGWPDKPSRINDVARDLPVEPVMPMATLPATPQTLPVAPKVDDPVSRPETQGKLTVNTVIATQPKQSPAASQVIPPQEDKFATAVPPGGYWSRLPMLVGMIWLAGTVAWFTLAGTRLLRFHRLLALGRPPTPELRSLARQTARRLHVRCPQILLLPGVISPMLWVFGRRARLLLPAELVSYLTQQQWQTLLAHELAHWRRRDHWVRWLEVAVLGLYWWCPLVWWAKRQLQQAEEECCDAWVVATFPEAAKAYALALVQTVDFVSRAQVVLPPAASGLGRVQLLRRRVSMILSGRTPRTLTFTGLLVVVMLGLALLPVTPNWARAESSLQQDERDKKVDDKDAIDKAQKDLQKLQDDLFRLQQEMDQKRREFEEKLAKEYGEKQQDLLKRMNEALKKAGLQGAGVGFGGFGGIGGFGPAAPAQPGLVPPPIVVQPLQPGFVAPNPGAVPAPLQLFPGVGPRGGDLERRLEELERKIDRLMQKLGGDTPKGVPNRAPENGVSVDELPRARTAVPVPLDPKERIERDPE
ncbi:MAG: M48 family metalloprotease [Gemmataceae bacterium]|nr:M48 family metalloprotease [Gemmataceae bacterium]